MVCPESSRPVMTRSPSARPVESVPRGIAGLSTLANCDFGAELERKSSKSVRGVGKMSPGVLLPFLVVAVEFGPIPIKPLSPDSLLSAAKSPIKVK